MCKAYNNVTTIQLKKERDILTINCYSFEFDQLSSYFDFSPHILRFVNPGYSWSIDSVDRMSNYQSRQTISVDQDRYTSRPGSIHNSNLANRQLEKSQGTQKN